MQPARSRHIALFLALETVLILVVTLLWLAAPAAYAGPDAPDVEYPYICAADGEGSVSTLRTYIVGANTNSGLDEIVVVPAASSTASECTFSPMTAEGNYGRGDVALPLITDPLVIRGDGIDVVLERQGTDLFRLLEATADMTLENVTVRNGRTATSRRGGGILAHQSLTLTNVILTGNVSYGGGGAYVGGSLTMNHTVVGDNEARQGDPSYGGGVWVEGDLTAEAITVTGNVGDNAYGPGLYVGGAAQIDGAWFAENVGRRGGGLYAAGDLSVATADFYSNTAESYGGGLLATAALSLSDTTFAYNQADYGGGLYVETEGPDVRVTGAIFEHNTASTSGGGLYVLRHVDVESSTFAGNEVTAGGGGAFVTSANVDASLFEENTASGLGADYAGGGLLALNYATVESSRFLNNSAPEGAGVFLAHTSSGSVSVLVNNLWVENDANEGAAIFAGFTADQQGGGHAEINHNTIVRQAQDGGSAVQVVEGSANIYNNIITRHTVGVSAGPQATVISDYNLFFANAVRHAGVPPGANNLDGDPLFVGATVGNYHLHFNSPAVDSGADLGVTVALDGVSRPQRSGFDRGAYEYVNVPPTATADAYTTTAATPRTVSPPGVLGNDGDFEGDNLTAVLANAPDHGNLILNPDGSFTYTPDPGFTGSDAFTYRADDGYDRSSPATVTLVVEPVRLYLPTALRP